MKLCHVLGSCSDFTADDLETRSSLTIMALTYLSSKVIKIHIWHAFVWEPDCLWNHFDGNKSFSVWFFFSIKTHFRIWTITDLSWQWFWLWVSKWPGSGVKTKYHMPFRRTASVLPDQKIRLIFKQVLNEISCQTTVLKLLQELEN